jgi:hypothetical protein
MANPQTTVRSLPTRVDRYPAKMISHLAYKLVDRYAIGASHVLDPFCGSGAVLCAASSRKIRVTGVDVNPFGVLLSRVKVEGFDSTRSFRLLNELFQIMEKIDPIPVDWKNKTYWYTTATLKKLEKIRGAAMALNLGDSKSGRAILLAIGLSARLCSRADQRSPKPFISKSAKSKRMGKHFDPTIIIESLLFELAQLHGGRRDTKAEVLERDIGNCESISGLEKNCSHVITSPPYINAQDYFRNSKLELYLLEGLLPFCVDDVRRRFIGSERSLDRACLDGSGADERREFVSELHRLEKIRPDLAVIVHTYFSKMQNALELTKRAMMPNGTLVIVCGDNLIGGMRIVTWRILNAMIEALGFTKFDCFEDEIRNRALAPTRRGHKGLIKQEVVSAFTLNEIRKKSKSSH